MKIEQISLTAEEVTLTAYLLDESAEMENARIRPAILLCPGGGYQMCSDREAEPVAMAFLAEGYHVFILRYSLKEKAAFPQPLKDAEEALRLIRKNAEIWNIDREKVAACGFSAGGHLAACLGTMGAERPDALILGYPVIFNIAGPILSSEIPSAAEAVDEKTPPSFIFTASDDIVVPMEHSLKLAAALDQKRIPFALHIFHKGGHGFSLAKGVTASGKKKMQNAENAKWFSMCIRWLEDLGWGFPEQDASDLFSAADGYCVDLPFGILWNQEQCRAVILTFMPQMKDAPGLDSITDVTLRKMLEYSDGMKEDVIAEIDRRLKEV